MFKTDRTTESEPISPREKIYDELAGLASMSTDSFLRSLGKKESSEIFGTTPSRHPDSQRFHDLLREVGELHDRKQATYGRPDSPFENYLTSAEIAIQPWRYVVARVREKMTRLQALTKDLNTDEDAVSEELKDIAACSLIAIVLMERAAGSPSKKALSREEITAILGDETR